MRTVTWSCDWCASKTLDELLVERNWGEQDGQLLCTECLTERSRAINDAHERRASQRQSKEP